jgi:murein DD-endopeptidase MepM/ murein hydrolase activator NlpD
MRTVKVLLVLILLAAAGVFVAAGYLSGPAVDIVSPAKFVGVSTPVDVRVDAPGRRLTSVTIEFEQNGARTTLATIAGTAAQTTAAAGALTHDAADPADRVHVAATVSRETVPKLQSGPARLIVRAVRPVVYGVRQVSTELIRDVQVRLEKPRIEVISTHHYINLGGSEMIVYRVQPADVQSGVRVGDVEYPGFPASGATVEGGHLTDPAVRVAFFALRFDQDVNTPMQLYARDEAGNTTAADFEHQTFPKVFKSSTIPLDDKFLDRVVPAILAGTTEVKPSGSTIDQFVVINSELRHKNAETIREQAAKTSPELLWRGEVFYPFVNHAVESAFADHRTYVYGGRTVDQQTHLGFDLASVVHAPVLAANRGRVVFAQELGIYGNCVIIDHGMGVQSLYGHLSSVAVKVGDDVEKAQPIGKTGITGLAGGDHLHFTMLVNGQMVNPVEWWDPHWIQDRVLRKLR